MATPVTMPKQGQSVESCIITSWFKKKGEKVSVGDLLFSYETDKAAFDMESPANGILLDIFFGEGEEVPVLVNVAVVGNEGEPTNSFRPSELSCKNESAALNTIVGKSEHIDIVDNVESQSDSRIRISPRARLIAQKNGIDTNMIKGSGPGGRIIVKDIKEIAGGQPAGAFTDKPLSNMRMLIAKAMHSSLQNSAQLTHHMSADVRRILEARNAIKAKSANGTSKQDITLNDMICWCVIRALLSFPEMNSHFLDNKIRTFSSVHLGLAVDTPRGLMVPAIRDTESMDISTLSMELKKASDACRKGNIDPELLRSTAATFTVSNLGNYGVEMFTPVLNIPQTGILGVCTITNRAQEMSDGNFALVPVIGLSLTYDHRSVDGGPATLFLKEIKENIESFVYYSQAGEEGC